MSFDLKLDDEDTSVPVTGFLFGKDADESSVPSIYAIQSLINMMSGYLATAVLAESAVPYSFPAPGNHRVMTVVMTAGALVTLPGPVANLILNVKAAPGVTGVAVTGHIDGEAAATAAVSPGSSAQFHGGTSTWWVI